MLPRFQNYSDGSIGTETDRIYPELAEDNKDSFLEARAEPVDLPGENQKNEEGRESTNLAAGA